MSRILIFFKNNFLSNRGVRQTIVKNVFWMGCAEGLPSISKFFLFIIVARELGVEMYGVFNFAFTFVGFFAFILDFGIAQLIIRDYSKDQERQKQFWDVLSIKIITVPLYLVVLAGVYFLMSQTQSFLPLVAILALSFIIGDLLSTFYVVFRARQQMEYEFLPKILQAVLVFIFGLIAVEQHSILLLAGAYALSSLCVFLPSIVFFHRRIARIRLSINLDFMTRIFKETLPIVTATACTITLSTIDVLLLGKFESMAAVGFYNSAYRIIALISLCGGLIVQGFYPKLASLIVDREQFMQLWRLQVNILFVVACVTAAIIFALAPFIIIALYTEQFEPAIAVLRLLSISLPFIFLYIAFQYYFFLIGKQRLFTYIIGGAVILNILANILFIPVYGMYAVAVIMVCTHIALVAVSGGVVALTKHPR